MTLDAPTSPTKTVTCPYCKSNETDRIPRAKLLKKILPWISIKHYMCYSCLRKFYSFKG